MFVVLVRYNKYINKVMGLEGLQWFFLFPLVVSLSVVCFWLYQLLKTVEQPSSAVYSHNSAWEVEITPYRKLQDKAWLISSTLTNTFFYFWWRRGWGFTKFCVALFTTGLQNSFFGKKKKSTNSSNTQNPWYLIILC